MTGIVSWVTSLPLLSASREPLLISFSPSLLSSLADASLAFTSSTPFVCVCVDVQGRGREQRSPGTRCRLTREAGSSSRGETKTLDSRSLSHTPSATHTSAAPAYPVMTKGARDVLHQSPGDRTRAQEQEVGWRQETRQRTRVADRDSQAGAAAATGGEMLVSRKDVADDGSRGCVVVMAMVAVVVPLSCR